MGLFPFIFETDLNFFFFFFSTLSGMADVCPGAKACDTHVTGASVESHGCILTSS